LSLPADPAPPAVPQGGTSSPDPGSLTVLQPANNNVATAAASPYSTMLPGFAHYSTGKSRVTPILGAKAELGYVWQRKLDLFYFKTRCFPMSLKICSMYSNESSSYFESGKGILYFEPF
jgi:hypothetical protein